MNSQPAKASTFVGAQRAKAKRMTSVAPLIISLGLDPESFEILNDLRSRHFPRERLKVGAHVTLFHALPGERESEIRQLLEQICSIQSPYPVRFSTVFSLGKGVAINAECAPLLRLRDYLAKEWRPFLTPQDAQPYRRPHVTIQNKVTPEEARATFQQVSDTFKPFDGRGEGLRLWRYRGGFWDDAGLFGFAFPDIRPDI